MANKPIIMSKLKQIFQLRSQGHGTRKISTITGVSRNVVKQYLSRLYELKRDLTDILSLDERTLQELFQPGKHEQIVHPERHLRLQALLPELSRMLRRRGMTIKKVYQHYKSTESDAYGMTQFYEYMRAYRNRTTGTMHVEHKAGDKLFVDFTGDKLQLVDPDTGEVKEVEVFVAVLGCSQLTYVEATMNQSLYDFIDCCRNALHYFGGVPALIVPDNLKAAVTKSSKYEAIINEVFGSFAEHYNTNVLPARPYKPKDKSLVEGAVKLTYKEIFTRLYGRVFHSLEQLNKAILTELDAYNKAPLNKAESRWELFEKEEREALRALPLLEYTPCEIKEYKVMKHGHVMLHKDRHQYSVPYQMIGKRVRLLYNSLRVRIYHKDQLVAEHERNYGRNKFSTNPDHLASNHKFMTEWNPEYFIAKGNEIGTDVGLYIEKVMESKGHPEMAYKACNGILNLGRRTSNERLIQACRKAYRLGVFNYHFVEDLLTRRIEQEDPEEIVIQRITPNHKNVRGKEYYTQSTISLN